MGSPKIRAEQLLNRYNSSIAPRRGGPARRMERFAALGFSCSTGSARSHWADPYALRGTVLAYSLFRWPGEGAGGKPVTQILGLGRKSRGLTWGVERMSFGFDLRFTPREDAYGKILNLARQQATLEQLLDADDQVLAVACGHRALDKRLQLPRLWVEVKPGQEPEFATSSSELRRAALSAVEPGYTGPPLACTQAPHSRHPEGAQLLGADRDDQGWLHLQWEDSTELLPPCAVLRPLLVVGGRFSGQVADFAPRRWYERWSKLTAALGEPVWEYLLCQTVRAHELNYRGLRWWPAEWLLRDSIAPELALLEDYSALLETVWDDGAVGQLTAEQIQELQILDIIGDPESSNREKDLVAPGPEQMAQLVAAGHPAVGHAIKSMPRLQVVYRDQLAGPGYDFFTVPGEWERRFCMGASLSGRPVAAPVLLPLPQPTSSEPQPAA